ncbi:MAG: C4-type zinc ribbon domain-containing protein [Kiritimatiellaeota bacterium]|nr:C4-type zinc ribbon domain-containing protein [Kiritimatiellota bacterium]
MSPLIEKLLTLQDRDRKMLQLLREQKDVPARKQLIESRLQAHRESLKAAQEEIQKHTATLKNLEVEIDGKKELIKKYREQQLQAKKNEEYKALEHEITTVQRQIRALEDKEIVEMERMEQLQAVQGEHQQDFQAEEKQVRSEFQVLEQRVGNIQKELDALRAERAGIVCGVDPAWLSRYDRIFQKTGNFAMVPVEKSCCGGCHMTLPPSVVHDARRGTAITTCNYCGRMLYAII